MHRLSAVLVLAGFAAERTSAAVPNLPSCQSRCYDQTAELIGCGKDDYACHCGAFQSQFVPQLQSCMIEGCAFDNEPLNVTELQSTVCALAGQSPEPTPSSGSPSGSDPQPSQPPSATPTESSDSSDPTDSAEPGDEGAASALPVTNAGVAAGILAAMIAGVYLF